MNGRVESELRIESYINEKLKEMPDYVVEWALSLKASRKTAATRRTYITNVCNLLQHINPDTKNVKLEDINHINVMEFFTSIQTKETKDGEIVETSDSYQQEIWCSLNNFFNYLVLVRKIDTNYIQIIDKPRNKDLPRVNAKRVHLTEDDFKNILEATNTACDKIRRARDKAIILTFMNTGMRRNALVSINMSDIDFNNKTLRVVDKGNKFIEYSISPALETAIKDWINVRDDYDVADEHDALFLSRYGNRISRDVAYNVVKKYTLRGIGKSLSPHKLRAGFCSIIYDKTKDLEFARRAMHHSSSTVTQRYIVTNGNEDKTAASIIGNIFA